MSSSRTDLLRQLYVLINWDRSCRSNLLSHPVTVQKQRQPVLALSPWQSSQRVPPVSKLLTAMTWPGKLRFNPCMYGKLKLVPSPTCPCGQEDQTTKHVLQRCPLHKATREGVWPVSTPLKTKLYSCKELDKTTSFISWVALIVWPTNVEKKYTCVCLF